MLDKNLREILKFIFLPALLLSLFLSGSSALFQYSQIILIGNQIGFEHVPALKMLTIVPQILFALTLLIFAFFKPFEKIFRGTLITLTGIIVILTGLVFFQDHFGLNDVSETWGIYTPLMDHWPVSLMYLGLSLINFNLFSLFIWGFINRLSSLPEGTKYYIPFALVLGALGAIIPNYGLTLIGASKWPLMGLVIPAIVLMICSLFIFNWSWKRLPDNLIHPKDEPAVLQTRFPFLSAAYLLAGCLMVKNILDLLFKSQMKAQFSDPTAFQTMMGYYFTSVGASIIIISIIWAVLCTWLILKKGWKTTALTASLSIFVGGIIYLSLSSSWLSHGIFTGLLASTTSVLFFPLIQMLYLYLPSQNRFKIKVATEMIVLPVLIWLASRSTMVLLVVFGSITVISFYLKILITILMTLLIIVSYRIGLKVLGANKITVGSPAEVKNIL